MSTLQTLLLRRSTIESTQKMMSAMRVVAATRLRKLQNMFTHVAQQEKDLSNLLRSSTIDQDTAPLPFYASGALKTHSKKSAAQCLDSHMLSLKDGTLKKPIIWVVLGADKGLCGSFHTQILRIMRSFQPLFMQKNSSLFVWGQKTSKLIERQGFNITHAKPIGRMSALERVKHTLDTIEDSPTKPQLGFVWLQFKTALSQTPRIATLSYLLDTLFSEEKKITLSEQRFLVEPNAQNFLKYFFPFYTKKRMLLLFLEASLSEEGTRMAAMDSASRNSDDILKDITLLYNRTRQAMITKELIEVVSGANAL